MKKFAAALMALCTLSCIGGPIAHAAPRSGGEIVTYRVSIKKGPATNTYYEYYANGTSVYGYMMAPFTVSTQGYGAKGIHATTATYAKPTYICSVIVNGVLKVQNEGVGGARCDDY